MKKIIYMLGLLFIVIMSSSVYGIARSVSGQTITYTITDKVFSNQAKSYWAVNDNLISCSSTGANDVSKVACGADCEYSVTNNLIKLVVYPPSDSSHSLPTSKQITLSGSGTCTLSGDYAEAVSGSPGQKLAMVVIGTDSIDFGGGGECSMLGDISQPCDNKVSDQELLTYMGRWKAEHRTVDCDTTPSCVSDSRLLTAMTNWKNTHRS